LAVILAAIGTVVALSLLFDLNGSTTSRKLKNLITDAAD
jgi:hypothetical protein